MMHGSGSGFGWMLPMSGMMLGSVLLTALIVGLVVWFVVGSVPGRGTARDDLGGARRILAERFARGEFDTDEYARLRDALR
jgi:putative membrane protein